MYITIKKTPNKKKTKKDEKKSLRENDATFNEFGNLFSLHSHTLLPIQSPYLLSSIGKAEEDLDVFENDGFIVDDAEDDEEEEGENKKQAQKKKKERLLLIPTLLCIFIHLHCVFITVCFCYSFSGNHWKTLFLTMRILSWFARTRASIKKHWLASASIL